MIEVKVNGFRREELRQGARIQVEELNEGFLSSMGDRALELIFAHVAESPWGILVLAVDSECDQVVGYVFGTKSTSGLYKDFLLRKLPAALFYFLPKMLTVQRIKKAFETLLYPAKTQPDDLPRAELLDLAVSRPYQGTGVAQQLFAGFVTECRNRGLQAFRIPTSASLTRAHRFYEKMGARQAGSVEVHRGQETFVYVYQVEDNEHAN